MSYQLGKLTAMADFTDTTFKGYGATSHMRVYETGGFYYLTTGTFVALGYQHTTFEDHYWNSVSLGLTQDLSKRTSVYVGADYLKASAGVGANIGYNFEPSGTGQQWMARVGMFHAF